MFKDDSSTIVNMSGIDTWKKMKYGLFVHHVFGAGVEDMTPLTSEGGYSDNIDEFVSFFNVEKWAEDVQSMGFEYVIFTAWHLNMNALYPSKVMEKWRGTGHSTTSRDLIGEIIDALLARGIKPALYSSIWDGHNFHPRGEGYYAYYNRDGIITDEQRKTGYFPSAEEHGDFTIWDNFMEEIYEELAQRYGNKIKAMWFDSTWVHRIDKKRIMATVHKYNPTCACIANGTIDHGMPFCSKEVGDPDSYDYGFKNLYDKADNSDVNTWLPYERNVVIIQGGDWWAKVGGKPRFNSKQIYLYTVLQAGVNTQGGGISWSFGTYADSSFETDMVTTLKKTYDYIKPVESSIKNTYPSTSYITKEATRIPELNNGIVATKSIDDVYEYIHVLIPPKERTLVLPAPSDNKLFKKGILLKSGKAIQLEQTEVAVSITIDEDWDELDTVIELWIR